MALRPAFEQTSVMPFFTRLAVLVAAGCFLPALNAAAEDEVPPTAGAMSSLSSTTSFRSLSC
jgi:hypothetical protein